MEDVAAAVDFRLASLAGTHERPLPRPVLTRATVLGNDPLQSDYWRLTLDAPISPNARSPVSSRC